MSEILLKNLSHITKELSERIMYSNPIGIVEKTKSGLDNLLINGIYFHSKHDPLVEAKRLLDGLKKSEEKNLKNQIEIKQIDLANFNSSSLSKEYDLVFSNFGGLNCINENLFPK
jgi:hypothetical protein